jgi:hypothetical protein
MDFKQERIIPFGFGGVGKTHALASIFLLKEYNPNMRMIFIGIDKNALSGIERGLKFYNIQLEPGELIICIHTDTKAKQGFKNQIAAAKKFATDDASKSSVTTDNRTKYSEFIAVCEGIDALKGYDYVTREEITIGSSFDLDINDILVLDGLTFIMDSIWALTTGDRLLVDYYVDYKAVQRQLTIFTNNLNKLSCSVIMLAHADKIVDDVEKKEQIRIKLDAGTALASSYIGKWSDVIYCYKEGNERYWSGSSRGVETVARNFPEEAKLAPNYSLYDFFISNEDKEKLNQEKQNG